MNSVVRYAFIGMIVAGTVPACAAERSSRVEQVVSGVDQFSPLRDLSSQPELQHIDPLLGLSAIKKGADTVGEGVDHLAHGHVVEGGLAVSGGAAGTIGGTATALRSTTAVTEIGGFSLSTVAGAAGGIAATADGLRDILNGRSSVGATKTLAGTLMIDGALTVCPYASIGGAALWVGASAWELASTWRISFGMR